MEKVACRTPAAEGVTNIPAWKFEALRGAILEAVAEAGPEGLLYKEMNDVVRPKLTADELARLGKLGWHVVSVKLELEVRGELARVEGAKPQRVVIGQQSG